MSTILEKIFRHRSAICAPRLVEWRMGQYRRAELVMRLDVGGSIRAVLCAETEMRTPKKITHFRLSDQVIRTYVRVEKNGQSQEFPSLTDAFPSLEMPERYLDAWERVIDLSLMTKDDLHSANNRLKT